MKEHPILFNTEMVCAILNGIKTQTRRPAKIPLHATQEEADRTCPPYAPGDLLWVRETWCESPRGYLYRANSRQSKIRWRPSIHMPRKACRLFLEVDDVGVHRLQDISEEDAKAEGMESIAVFHSAWNRLYAALQYRWEMNPWVCCIKFHIAELKT